jgi:hypothetical protein
MPSPTSPRVRSAKSCSQLLVSGVTAMCKRYYAATPMTILPTYPPAARLARRATGARAAGLRVDHVARSAACPAARGRVDAMAVDLRGDRLVEEHLAGVHDPVLADVRLQVDVRRAARIPPGKTVRKLALPSAFERWWPRR